ncbi:MAG: c-type cytochrome [Burkholderiaceae bacterium]
MKLKSMAGAALILAAMSSLAQDKETLYVKSLAATCANCHGTHGRVVDGSSVASLAGLPREHIVAQMQAFKAGTRAATVMHQISKGYSDAQIEQIAGYFAAQKK